jgi:hypothetical protein
MLCHFASELGEKPSSRTQQFTNALVRFPFGYSLVVPNTVTEDRNERTSMDMAARYP